MASAAPVVPGIPAERFASPTRAWLAWITLVSMFAGALKVSIGFDWRLSYLLVLVAIGIMVFMTARPRVLLRPLLGLYAYLAFCALWVVAHEPALLLRYALPQIIGIGVFAGFFFAFLATVSISPRALFERYVDLACAVTVIGYPILAYTTLANGFFRFRGTLAEPTHYALAIMPALAFALANFRHKRWQALLLLSGMVLSFSLTGYIGLVLILALTIGRRLRTRLLLIVVTGALAAGAYSTSSEIRSRIDDTASVASTGDFGGVNLSTYALLSNLYVAWRSFEASPVFGGGLGSHQVNHHRYIGTLTGLDDFADTLDQNAQDGNSLLVRTLSEQGLVGIGLLLLFMVRYARADNTVDQTILTGILIYFVTKLIREGHYFTPEFFFMVGIYYMLGSKRFRSGADPAIRKDD